MDYEHVLRESQLIEHGTSFGFALESGYNEYKRLLQQPFTTSTAVLYSKQEEISTLRKYPQLLNEIQTQLQSLKDDETLILQHKQTETSKVAEGQIFFTGENTKCLNFIPFLITLCVFLKIWVAPILALLMPLVLCIMPYIVMKTVMDMDIQWEMYKQMMKHMVLGIQNGEPWRLKHYGQVLWTGVSVLQGVITPFLTAYHTRNLDREIIKRGRALLSVANKLREVVGRLRAIGILNTPLWDVPEIPREVHEAAAWMDFEPLGMLQIQRVLGRVVLLVTISRDDSWRPVQWKGGSDESLDIHNFADLAIPQSISRHSDVRLEKHAMLTGPNRGGKSSNLRAILQQVLLGQTFGFTKGAIGSWKPFRFIFTRLKSHDTAGKESLFEMEVRHASNIIREIVKKRYHSLVLIDELFHSTNPPDAEISAKVFLKKLWKVPYAKSIISTHIFGLCDLEYGKNIQQLCCPASVSQDDMIKYSYCIQPGICRVSSVKEVLRESGLYDL